MKKKTAETPVKISAIEEAEAMMGLVKRLPEAGCVKEGEGCAIYGTKAVLGERSAFSGMRATHALRDRLPKGRKIVGAFSSTERSHRRS